MGEACAPAGVDGKRGVRLGIRPVPAERDLCCCPVVWPTRELCMSAVRDGDMRPGNEGGGWNWCFMPGGTWPGIPVFGFVA